MKNRTPLALLCALSLATACAGDPAAGDGKPADTSLASTTDTTADGGALDETADPNREGVLEGSTSEGSTSREPQGETSCECDHGACLSALDPDTGREHTACACDRGWAGEACDECAEGYAGEDCDECAEGFVRSESNATLCNPDPCADDPCSGRGECSVEQDALLGASIACECDAGFDGDACETCAEGHVGDDCAECADGYALDDSGACVVSACVDVVCGEHGVCVDRKGTGVCVCDDGWSGDACDECAPGYTLQYGKCVIDLCLGVECGSHGECVSFTGVAGCACDTGYTHDDDGACTACDAGYVPVSVGPVSLCRNRLPVIDSRLISQFDAAATGTFTLEGDAVRVWDQARGDGTLWAESVGKRPTYEVLPNGVRFNGSQWMYSPTKTLRKGDNYTVFMVASWKANAGQQSLLDSIYMVSGKFTEAFSLTALDSKTLRFRHRGIDDVGSDSVTSNKFDASKGRQLIVVRRGPFLNSSLLQLSNGTTAVSAPSPKSGFSTENIQTLVGRCHGEGANVYCPLQGAVHELVFYEGAMTDAEVEATEAYLRVKWDL